MAVDFAKQKPKQVWQLPFGASWPTSVAFLADGKLAAGDQLGRILIWDMNGEPTKEAKAKNQTAPATAPVRMLVGHTNAVSRLRASPDGRRLYSASLDHTIRIWNLDSATTGTAETSLDPNADDNRNNKTKTPPPVVKLPTQEAEKALTGHTEWVQALDLSSDGKRLISGDDKSQVIVWDAETGAEVNRWSGLAWNWIVAVALSPDGKTALVSEARGKRDDFDIPAAACRLWDVATGKETLDLLKVQIPKYDRTATSYESAQSWRKFTGGGLISVAFSPDGKQLAAVQSGEIDKGVAHVLDATDGKLIRDVGSHQYGMTDVCFTADGQFLLTTGRDTCLRITKVADGKETAQLGTPRGGQFKDWFSAVAKSSDEKWLAAADIAGWVHVWSTDAK
jgi:WD40 repeat protein